MASKCPQCGSPGTELLTGFVCDGPGCAWYKPSAKCVDYSEPVRMSNTDWKITQTAHAAHGYATHVTPPSRPSVLSVWKWLKTTVGIYENKAQYNLSTILVQCQHAQQTLLEVSNDGQNWVPV